MDTNTFAPPLTKNTPSKNTFELPKQSSVIVIGAGAFGGWSALYLLRAGYHVTLIDAWGAGNSRSSSGDETRVIRSTYGANKIYFDLNVRALELWKENEARFGKKLFHNAGVIWFCYNEKTPVVDDSMPFAKVHRMEYRYLSPKEINKIYPIVNTDDLHHAWLDPFGGYLMAKQSCQAVLERFVKEGGNFIQAFVKPGKITSEKMDSIQLSNGETLTADAYIFACGSWLSQIFPEALANVITCTKQEAYYFGVPSSHSLAFDQFPAWIDVDGKDHYYGIPGNGNRGFKIGVDKHGVKFDPTDGERLADPKVLADARKFIEHRFPPLKGAPLVENRVCPYENSPDGNFIFDFLPGAVNAFVLGGGTGHGFKHGPALGEYVASVFMRKRDHLSFRFLK
ncbi:MAG: FAD-dependent oxidoreductase [Flammeovirgaceae bacterium]|nr:FAD-dependent oxidoreductase [Flammeovirgaceae bacterium]